MKNKFIARKLLATLLAGSMLVSMVGCGDSESGKQESESKTSEVKEQESASEGKVESDGAFDPRSITEGVTLTIAVEDRTRIQDYETNHMTKMIEEELGVNLDFVEISDVDYYTKLNLQVSSGEKLPDIIFAASEDSINEWKKEGVLLELSKYYENPDYTKYMSAYEEESDYDFSTAMSDTNGEIYALPSLADTLEDTAYKMWIYKPWLDAVGLDVPTTTEEYYEACKAIVKADPNGNGKADEMAISGNGLFCWFGYYMSPFVYAYDGEYRVIDNGEISFAYTSEQWKEGLKYIRKFFDEELIPRSVLTNDWNQWWGQMFADEVTNLSLLWFYYNGSEEQAQKYGTDYVCIPALEGPEGHKQAYYGFTNPTPGAVITVDCENPDAAFLVLDYMCSEEMGLTTRYGQRGVDWDYWEDAKVEDKSAYVPSFEGYDISIILYDDAAFWGGTDPQNASYLMRGPYIIQHDVYMGMAKLNEENPIGMAAVMEDYYDSVTEVVSTIDKSKYLPKLVLTPEETDEIADIKANLATYVTESIMAFITGDKDVDKEWDAYLAELEKIGYQKVLDVYQTAYDRMYK